MSVVFFACFYSNHLTIREEMQLFLFTPEYFVSYLFAPSCLSSYSSCFITQFFVSGFSGAFLLTFIYLVEWLLAAKVVRKISDIPNVEFYVFLLSASEAVRFASLSFSTDITFSMIYSLLSVLLTLRVKKAGWRNVVCCCMMPVLYYLTGVVGMVVFSLTCMSVDLARGKVNWIVAIFSAVSLAAIYLATGCLLPADMDWGYGCLPPVAWVAVMALLLMVPRYKPYMGMGEPVAVYAVSVLFAATGIAMNADFEEERLLEADRAARCGDWDRVLASVGGCEAEKNSVAGYFRAMALLSKGTPPDSMLAMGVEPECFFAAGKLADVAGGRLFADEIHWQMRDYNLAAIAAMSSMADAGGRCPVRALRRMAEICFETSDTVLFEKYASVLERTIVYRHWARGMRRDFYSARDSATVGVAHGTVGGELAPSLRNVDDMAASLEALLEHGGRNRLAFDCLAYSYLHDRDIDALARICRKYGGECYGADLPEFYSEAMALDDFLDGYATATERSMAKKAKTDKRYARIVRFMELYKGGNADAALLRKEFSGSYLGYYFDIDSLDDAYGN